ncbi:hypothetical protein DMN91_005520 [Ooceraea biroi]|uniref:Uncharacterized protein n=1 Tax=Ooceraea biroi TaxID=2015173 RepID=A0A3L8DL50_OOCBI|nr:hypothetical protein DMN91_005520 [Ooceraea biroi]
MSRDASGTETGLCGPLPTRAYPDSSAFNADTSLPEAHNGFATRAEFKHLSDADRITLESLDVNRYRPRHTGRFLTMHKRRRKRLITRSLNQEPGILDDIFHGLVQYFPLWYNQFRDLTISAAQNGPNAAEWANYYSVSML